MYYRPAADANKSNDNCDTDISEPISEASTSFLLIYQSAWQRRMLIRYVEELKFMDATYKTTKYALPLFFICIMTNCGYCVVGVFVIENEDSISLAEVLRIFSSMNDNWSPKAAIIDSSDVEMKVLASTFPGINSNCNIFLTCGTNFIGCCAPKVTCIVQYTHIFLRRVLLMSCSL